MSDKYIGLYDEIKRNSLLKSIHEAARKVVEGCYEAIIEDTENIPSEYLMSDGRPKPSWVYDCIHDQISESLYGDTQADDIEPDADLFPESEYEGKYEKGNKWNLIERYLDNEVVDEIFYEEWDKLIEEKYGANWREIK